MAIRTGAHPHTLRLCRHTSDFDASRTLCGEQISDRATRFARAARSHGEVREHYEVYESIRVGEAAGLLREASRFFISISERRRSRPRQNRRTARRNGHCGNSRDAARMAPFLSFTAEEPEGARAGRFRRRSDRDVLAVSEVEHDALSTNGVASSKCVRWSTSKIDAVRTKAATALIASPVHIDAPPDALRSCEPRERFEVRHDHFAGGDGPQRIIWRWSSPLHAPKCERCWHWRDEVGKMRRIRLCAAAAHNLYGVAKWEGRHDGPRVFTVDVMTCWHCASIIGLVS